MPLLKVRLLNVSVVVTLMVEVVFALLIKLTVPLLWVKVPPAVWVNSFEILRVPEVEVKVPPEMIRSPRLDALVILMVELPPLKAPAERVKTFPIVTVPEPASKLAEASEIPKVLLKVLVPLSRVMEPPVCENALVTVRLPAPPVYVPACTVSWFMVRVPELPSFTVALAAFRTILGMDPPFPRVMVRVVAPEIVMIALPPSKLVPVLRLPLSVTSPVFSTPSVRVRVPSTTSVSPLVIVEA